MRVVVVGGGLGGALKARALVMAGADVTVVDSGPEPGGVAVALHKEGYLLEPAVGTVRAPHPGLDRLLDGLDVRLTPARLEAQRRFVHHGGRTVEIRLGPGLLTSPLLSLGAKLRLAAEPLIRPGSDPEESLGRFLERRLGREAGRLTAWLAASGVHAGDPGRLGVQAAFPFLSSLEQTNGSLTRGMLARRARGAGGRPASMDVVEGGTAQIAAAVARSLGERWHASWPVQRVEERRGHWLVVGPEAIEADGVVLAVPPGPAARLLRGPPSAMLGAATSAPVAVVWLGTEGKPLPDGLGVLVGPEERFVTLGFLFESSYAPFRAPEGRGLVKAIVGGATRPGAVELPDDDLVGKVAHELGAVLGEAPAIGMSHVIRHRPGIPQYTSAWRRVLADIGRVLPPGLSLAGWGYDGVGLSQLAAAALLDARPTSGTEPLR